MRASTFVIGLVLFLHGLVTVMGALDGLCVLQATEIGELYGIKGTVRFTHNSDGITFKVTANIEGNKNFQNKTEYAMHVHTYGDITDHIAGESCGLHWSPVADQHHACPPTPTRHSGDMGNWTQADGKISMSKDLDMLEMTATSSIIGRSVVLHQNHDNCHGETGDSGNRLAICVIGITNEDYNYATANTMTDGSVGVCVFKPTEHCQGHCHGTAFVKLDALSKTGVTAELTLSQKGAHAFHMQTYGDLRSEKGDNLGDDYNPFGRDHGLPPMVPRHIGDLGNIQSYDAKTGQAWYRYEDTYFTPVHTILGRSMAVYDKADRGHGEGCSDTGNAGNIIMQCVIGLANPTTVIPTVPEGVKIDIQYTTHGCPSKRALNDEDAEAGLIAGLVFGWVLVGILLLVILAIFGYFMYLKKHGARFEIIPVHGQAQHYGSEL